MKRSSTNPETPLSLTDTCSLLRRDLNAAGREAAREIGCDTVAANSNAGPHDASAQYNVFA